MKLRSMPGLFLALTAFASTLTASAEQVTVAVASNFLGPLKELAAEFEKESGHQVRISSGSTGKLYAQIVHGAPYDVFLAANKREPARLEKEGLAVAGTRFTYALGRLVMWSADASLIQGDGSALLHSGRIDTVAMANPRTAPYGAAAQAVLQALQLKNGDLRVVRGENIGQAFQYAASGNAQIGFVALSQVRDPNNTITGSLWIIPSELYPAIAQQAVLLQRAAGSDVARAFLSFLQGDRVRQALVARYGYGAPSPMLATDMR